MLVKFRLFRSLRSLHSRVQLDLKRSRQVAALDDPRRARAAARARPRTARESAMSPAQNTLDAFLVRASSSTKPRERADVENVENVDPERARGDDARARAEDVANDALDGWSRVARACVARAATSTSTTSRRAEDVKRAAYAYATKMKNARRARGAKLNHEMTLVGDLWACERGIGAHGASKRLRFAVGGGASMRALVEYGACALPRVTNNARAAGANNAVNAIEFDATGGMVTSGTSAGAIDVQDVATLRTTAGELYCPKLKLSTDRYIDAMKWNHDASLVMTACDISSTVIAYRGDSTRVVGPRGMAPRTHVMHKYKVQTRTNNASLGLRDLKLDPKDPRCIIASASNGQAYLWDTRLAGDKQTAQLSSHLKTTAIASLVVSDDGHTVIGGDGDKGDLLIWDMRKATSNTAIGGLGDNTQYYSVVAQLSITKLLAKTALATDVKISDSGVHWIGCDPHDCRRLGYHLTNGWSGVLDLMKPCVTHAHCPPAPWLEARQSEVRPENSLEPDALSVPLSDLRRRTPCWLPDGGSFAVGLGAKPGVRILDFAPTPKSRHWIHGLTIADLEREPDGRYATGNEPVFIETSSKIFSVAAHPYHHGELIAGGESTLCLLGYGHVACGRDEDEGTTSVVEVGGAVDA